MLVFWTVSLQTRHAVCPIETSCPLTDERDTHTHKYTKKNTFFFLVTRLTKNRKTKAKKGRQFCV